MVVRDGDVEYLDLKPEPKYVQTDCYGRLTFSVSSGFWDKAQRERELERFDQVFKRMKIGSPRSRCYRDSKSAFKVLGALVGTGRYPRRAKIFYARLPLYKKTTEEGDRETGYKIIARIPDISYDLLDLNFNQLRFLGLAAGAHIQVSDKLSFQLSEEVREDLEAIVKRCNKIMVIKINHPSDALIQSYGGFDIFFGKSDKERIIGSLIDIYPRPGICNHLDFYDYVERNTTVQSSKRQGWKG